MYYICMVCMCQVPDDNGVSMQLLLGCIGAVNAVVLSPVLLFMVSSSYLSYREEYRYLQMSLAPCRCTFSICLTWTTWAR